jgi:hypothetical protein
MYIDRNTREEVNPTKQAEIALSILNYNQGLVQFADNKANALLLINSIFIASTGAFIETIRKGGGGFQSALVLVFFASSIISILISLAVIVTRRVPELQSRMKGMVFCSHIVEGNTPVKYVGDFEMCDIKSLLESILSDVFYVAHIAHTKFAIYNWGQSFTIISSIFWLLSFGTLLTAK